MAKSAESQRPRLRVDLDKRQMAALKARADAAGVVPAAIARDILERELGAEQTDARRLAAIGFTAPERKAVSARARRSGRDVWDFIRRASLDYVPKESREVAPLEWRLRIRCSEAQQTEIQERAEMVGLSPNQYLLKVGLGYEPKSVIDHKSVAKLLQTSGGLGRIGGLLKLWLTERPGEGVSPDDMRRVLNDLLELQHEIRLKARSL